MLGGLSGATAAPPSMGETALSPELFRRPWLAEALAPSAAEVMTMLSVEERQLLQWLTRSRFTGAGAIVDGGCFVGGSTLALAEGLRAAGGGAKIDVFDLFEVEPYMADLYFTDRGISPGESFRPLFDQNTAHVSDLLRVHGGDITQFGWDGDPIEILFIDIAKSWALNDFLVAEFFPCLIPGRSIVIQQDFVFAVCPWVILTMEMLAPYFEPVAFAEYCSVVYLCRRAVPRGLEPVSQLPHEVRMSLMDQAIGRFRGYPEGVLRCAKAALLYEHGDRGTAQLIVAEVRDSGDDHPAVTAALGIMDTLF